MNGSKPQNVGKCPFDCFDFAYNCLFGGLHEKGEVTLPNEETMTRWRDIFNSLSTDEIDFGAYTVTERVSCLRYSEDCLNLSIDGERTVAMETKSEYNLMTSLELLGNAFLKERLYQGAYKCYSMSHAYYVERFDHVHVKSRDIKRKIGRVLFEWGRYDEAIHELRFDARLDVYGTALDAEATLQIKYTYGRSLLAMNLTLEAVPFLYPYHLGQMDIKNNENKKILKSVAWITLECLIEERFEFSMSMAKRLIDIFSMRLHRGECPTEVLEFVATFSGYLRLVGDEERLVELYKTAYEIHSNSSSSDTNLLLSAIGCSFSEGSPYFKVSMDTVVLLHNHLMARMKDKEIHAFRCLKVTIGLVHVWAGREEAIKILLDSYNGLFHILDRNGPEFKLIHDCLMGRIYSPE